MQGLAVVLSGGGAKGAFQVGVLDELIARRGLRVDIFAGVSTGAIQALGGAQDHIPGLLEAWLTIRGDRDVYRPKPLGIVGGLLGASSLYDPSPIRARIRTFADEARLKASGRKLLLGVVSLNSGEFRSIREGTPRIADWVYASSAMPVYFPPYVTAATSGAGTEHWVDGGVRNVTPLDAALEQAPRAVLVIAASPAAAPAYVTTKFDGLVGIGLRSVSLLQSEVVRNDTGSAGLINELILARAEMRDRLTAAGVDPSVAARALAPLDERITRYRFAPIHVLAPDREYSGTLQFDPARIREAIAGGREVAARHWPEIQRLASADGPV